MEADGFYSNLTAIAVERIEVVDKNRSSTKPASWAGWSAEGEDIASSGSTLPLLRSGHASQ